jgi:hypothetical protein
VRRSFADAIGWPVARTSRHEMRAARQYSHEPQLAGRCGCMLPSSS